MEFPQSSKPPFVIPELLQRFRNFLFSVPGGPKATGDEGLSATISLAYIEAILVVRNELWNDKSVQQQRNQPQSLSIPAPAPSPSRLTAVCVLASGFGRASNTANHRTTCNVDTPHR